MGLTDELTNAYETFYKETKPTVNKNAENFADLISQGFHDGLKEMTSVLNVTGVIPGSPPTPYSGTEIIEFGDGADKATLRDELYKIKAFMEMNAKGFTALKGCREEAKVVTEALEKYFATTTPLTIHTGSVVSTVPPISSYKEPLAIQMLALPYGFIPGNKARAIAMAGVLVSILNPWIATITLNGAVTAPPANGTATGAWIPIT